MSTFIDNLLSFVPDELYIQLKYFKHFRRFANLKNPKTYNEKLQWLKLHDHNPIYHMMSDKYEVKKYISNLIGEEYVLKCLGVYDRFEDIDFSKLPKQFVLKCTHDSGGIVICNDKDKFDYDGARRKLTKALKTDYYYHSREYCYKGIKPRIIAEEYIQDDNGLPDYKFFCFDGVVKALEIVSNRDIKDKPTCNDFFDENFNHLDLIYTRPNYDGQINKPINFEKMKELAMILSKGYPHMRVDFYEVRGKVYFGEITFYCSSGFAPFVPEKWDYVFGDWLKL